MRCICTNSAGLEAEHGHKVKLKVLTSPSFSVTLPSCDPELVNVARATMEPIKPCDEKW